MRLSILIIIFSIISSCSNNDTAIKSEKDTYYLSKSSHYKLIDIETNDSRQLVILDSNHRIDQIQNVISIDGDSSYLNTWIGFDVQGNFDASKSYYYETFLVNENDKNFLECSLPNLLFEHSRCYILFSKYDDLFNSKSKIDTVWFDNNYLARVPIPKYKIGKNNIKFVIVEDELVNHRLKIKKTYVSKDFMVLHR